MVAGLGCCLALAGGTSCGAAVVVALAGGTICGAAVVVVGWLVAAAAVGCAGAGVSATRGSLAVLRSRMLMPVPLPIGGCRGCLRVGGGSPR